MRKFLNTRKIALQKMMKGIAQSKVALSTLLMTLVIAGGYFVLNYNLKSGSATVAAINFENPAQYTNEDLRSNGTTVITYYSQISGTRGNLMDAFGGVNVDLSAPGFKIKVGDEITINGADYRIAFITDPSTGEVVLNSAASSGTVSEIHGLIFTGCVFGTACPTVNLGSQMMTSFVASEFFSDQAAGDNAIVYDDKATPGNSTDDRIWIASASTLREYSPTTGWIADHNPGISIEEMVIDTAHNGIWMVSTSFGTPANTLAFYDIGAATLSTYTPGGTDLYGVTYDNRNDGDATNDVVWYVAGGDGSVDVFRVCADNDLARPCSRGDLIDSLNIVHPDLADASPTAQPMVYDSANDAIWVVENETAYVSKINASNNTLSASYTDVLDSFTPDSLAIDTANNRLWVVSGSGRLRNIDTVSATLNDSFFIGSTMSGVSVDSNNDLVWVSHGSSKIIRGVNPTTGATVVSHTIGAEAGGAYQGPGELLFDTVNNIVWSAGQGDPGNNIFVGVGGGVPTNAIHSLLTTDGISSIDTTNWASFDGIDITSADISEGDQYYTLSFDGGNSWRVWDGLAWRVVASNSVADHGGVDGNFYYRDGGTNWTSFTGCTGCDQGRLISLAVAPAANQMTKTTAESLTTTELTAAGGWDTSVNSINIAASYSKTYAFSNGAYSNVYLDAVGFTFPGATITDVRPIEGQGDDYIAIIGSAFGTNSGTVEISGSASSLTIAHWSNSLIIASLSCCGNADGTVTVTTFDSQVATFATNWTNLASPQFEFRESDNTALVSPEYPDGGTIYFRILDVNASPTFEVTFASATDSVVVSYPGAGWTIPNAGEYFYSTGVPVSLAPAAADGTLQFTATGTITVTAIDTAHPLNRFVYQRDWDSGSFGSNSLITTSGGFNIPTGYGEASTNIYVDRAFGVTKLTLGRSDDIFSAGTFNTFDTNADRVSYSISDNEGGVIQVFALDGDGIYGERVTSGGIHTWGGLGPILLQATGAGTQFNVIQSDSALSYVFYILWKDGTTGGLNKYDVLSGTLIWSQTVNPLISAGNQSFVSQGGNIYIQNAATGFVEIYTDNGGSVSGPITGSNTSDDGQVQFIAAGSIFKVTNRSSGTSIDVYTVAGNGDLILYDTFSDVDHAGFNIIGHTGTGSGQYYIAYTSDSTGYPMIESFGDGLFWSSPVTLASQVVKIGTYPNLRCEFFTDCLTSEARIYAAWQLEEDIGAGIPANASNYSIVSVGSSGGTVIGPSYTMMGLDFGVIDTSSNQSLASDGHGGNYFVGQNSSNEPTISLVDAVGNRQYSLSGSNLGIAAAQAVHFSSATQAFMLGYDDTGIEVGRFKIWRVELAYDLSQPGELTSMIFWHEPEDDDTKFWAFESDIDQPAGTEFQLTFSEDPSSVPDTSVHSSAAVNDLEEVLTGSSAPLFNDVNNGGTGSEYHRYRVILNPNVNQIDDSITPEVNLVAMNFHVNNEDIDLTGSVSAGATEPVQFMNSAFTLAVGGVNLGDPIYIQSQYPNMTGVGTLDVIVESFTDAGDTVPNDEETVTLTEVSPGVFQGSHPTASGAGVSGNGTLESSDTHLVRAHIPFFSPNGTTAFTSDLGNPFGLNLFATPLQDFSIIVGKLNTGTFTWDHAAIAYLTADQFENGQWKSFSIPQSSFVPYAGGAMNWADLNIISIHAITGDGTLAHNLQINLDNIENATYPTGIFDDFESYTVWGDATAAGWNDYTLDTNPTIHDGSGDDTVNTTFYAQEDIVAGTNKHGFGTGRLDGAGFSFGADNVEFDLKLLAENDEITATVAVPPPPPGGGPGPVPAISTPSLIGAEVFCNDTAKTSCTGGHYIRYSFNDNSTNETGFKLIDSAGTLILDVLTFDACGHSAGETGDCFIDYSSLSPNTSYDNLSIIAYNSQTSSSRLALPEIYTLANIPGQSTLTSVNDTTLRINFNLNGNPIDTELAIMVSFPDASGNIVTKYVIDTAGTLGDSPVYLPYSTWGGTSGFLLGNLTTGTIYTVAVSARNGLDNTNALTTAFGPSASAAPGEIIITLIKGVQVIEGTTLVQAANYGGLKYWLVQNLNNHSMGGVQTIFNFLLAAMVLLFLTSIFTIFRSLEGSGAKLNGNKIFLLPRILNKEASTFFGEYSSTLPNGTYEYSFAHHKRLHRLSRTSLFSSAGILAAKAALIVTIAVLGAQLQQSIAQEQYCFSSLCPSAKPGDTLSYILIWDNKTDQSIIPAVISDKLDSDVTYNSFSARGATATLRGDTLYFDLSGIPPRGTGSVTFEVTVNANASGQVSNQGILNGQLQAAAEPGPITAVSNTVSVAVAPATCTADVWECGSFGACVLGSQSRTCTMTYDCPGVTTPSPATVQACVVEPPIEEPPVTEPPVTEPPTTEPPVTEPPTTEPPTTEPPVTEPPTTEPPVTEPPTTEPPVIEPTPEDQTLLEQIILLGGLDNIIDEIFPFLGNPTLEKATEQIAVPSFLGFTAALTLPSVLAGAFNVLPYLHLLFLEPLYALFGRRKQKYGVVYNSLTKLPVDLAVVRIYDSVTKKLVTTKITDKQGRFYILAPLGAYYMAVNKPGFIYPTVYLKDDKEDAKFADVYHGEKIEVSQDGTPITVSVPLDPKEKVMSQEKVEISRFLWTKFKAFLPVSGIILTTIGLIIYPTLLMLAYLILHIALYVMFRRVVANRRPKSWGVVYDEKSGEKLKHAVVRIFDTRFNKLLETYVTDGSGRYNFLVGPNQYQVVGSRDGYMEHKTKQLDLTKVKSPDAIVAEDFGLKKGDDQGVVRLGKNVDIPLKQQEIGGGKMTVESETSGQTAPEDLDKLFDLEK